MMEINSILTLVFISIGAGFLFFGALTTRKLIGVADSQKYKSVWKALFVLMVIFLICYLAVIVLIVTDHSETLLFITGIVFFFGSVFVYSVVRTGLDTIVELMNTTVSKSYVENIIQSMADSLIVINTDKNSTIKTINNAAKNLLGYGSEELVGNSVSKVLKDDLKNMIRTDKIENLTEIETTYISRSGEEIPVELSASPLTASDGNLTGLIYIAQDIRERKKSEEKIQSYLKQLESSEEELKKLNDSKDKFFSIIAHDLKNPFGTVLGYSEIIAEDCLKLERSELQEFSISLNQQAKAVFSLLENLLNWSRLQTGRMPYEPEELDFEEVAKTTLELYAETAESKNINLSLIDGTSKKVWADKNMLQTTIRNLVSNAIKFTPDYGTIELSSEESDGKIKIAVRDSGLGISEEDSKKLFRIDINHTTIGTGEEKGTGLGLILCKELVEKNGGEISVNSKLGEGTTFFFTIPLVT
ncbi:MAG: PAS domain-containing sensor histidine kinase [Melioribacteraceae bacterium]|nr:PAS domain-containing sensor histidine kinase [Melioribacteraceae bacterium]